jgi:hypothetical protein
MDSKSLDEAEKRTIQWLRRPRDDVDPDVREIWISEKHRKLA